MLAGVSSYGEHASDFQRRRGRLYLAPSRQPSGAGPRSAVVIALGVAVTNEHLADIRQDARSEVAELRDLLCLPNNRAITLPTGAPAVGMRVVAYGTDAAVRCSVAHGDPPEYAGRGALVALLIQSTTSTAMPVRFSGGR